MDGLHFDRWTRALAGTSSRRSVLRGLAGLAGGLVGLGGAAGAGAITCPTGQVASGTRCLCKSTGRPPGPSGCPAGPGQTLCNGVAVDLTSDVNHCGICGSVCPASGQCMSPPVCRAGRCLATPLPAGTSCDDGNLCTTGDKCNGTGACIGTPKDCRGAGDQCNDGVCRPSDGVCVKQPRANGTSCDDGDACTRTDTCQAGVCVGGNPVVCDPADQCHQAGVCQAATGRCTYADQPDGTSCTDGNACTSGETCQAGVCRDGVPVSCPSPTNCQVSVACNPASGQCVSVNQPDGTLCGADNACTHDICQGGVCASNVPKDAGTACNDANACTQTDSCDGQGNCDGGALVVCVALDTCHGPGTCDAGTGACGNYPQLPGTCFVSGICFSPNDINPGNPCEHCDPALSATSFSPRADNTTCNDNDRCTTNDVCQGGVCTGTPVVCTALDQCHVAGTCDPATGLCTNPNATDGRSCNDGNACTSGENCQAGVCQGANPVSCPSGSQCDPQTGQCAAAGTVCSPTLTCPTGQLCCGPDQCYDPATGLICASTCDIFLVRPVPFAGTCQPNFFFIRSALCSQPVGGISEVESCEVPSSTCFPENCLDFQVVCPYKSSLVDGVCTFTCGAGTVCPDGWPCCANSGVCCNPVNQRCTPSPPMCIDVCPDLRDKCGGVCCTANQQCVNDVCEDICGGTTCSPGMLCCASISACCDAATQICGNGGCTPKPTCTATEVYVPELNVCCAQENACSRPGNPPTDCCAADETCINGLCFRLG